jgi:hypothetical protein
LCDSDIYGAQSIALDWIVLFWCCSSIGCVIAFVALFVGGVFATHDPLFLGKYIYDDMCKETYLCYPVEQHLPSHMSVSMLLLCPVLPTKTPTYFTFLMFCCQVYHRLTSAYWKDVVTGKTEYLKCPKDYVIKSL